MKQLKIFLEEKQSESKNRVDISIWLYYNTLVSDGLEKSPSPVYGARLELV